MRSVSVGSTRVRYLAEGWPRKATGVSVSLGVSVRIIEPRGPTGPLWRQRSLCTLRSVKRNQNSPRIRTANGA